MSYVDSAQLATAIRALYDRDKSGHEGKVANGIKASLIFQHRWEVLLLSAPVALASLGSCVVASSSNTSRALNLRPPKNGFKILKKSSLDANLVDSINLGRSAFLKAQTNMDHVSLASLRIYDQVDDVMDALTADETARAQLAALLNAMKRSADDCYLKAKDIDSEFEAWLNHAMELHAACVQIESSTEEKMRTTQLNMAVARSRFVVTGDAVKSTSETVNKFSKQVELAVQAYKRASDEFPNGWDPLGQQVVGALAETVTTALGQIITNLAANMNPVASAESGAEMFKDLIYGKDGPAPPTPSAPPAPKSTVPKDSTSPAYAEIMTDILYLGLINTILSKGKDGGVDWETAAGSNGARNQSAFFALSLLRDAQSRFQQVAADDEASQTLEKVLETAISVASSIQGEVDKAKNWPHNYPARDSDVVKGWKRSFEDAYEKANRMAAIARSLPGNTPGGAPIMSNNAEDPSVTITKADAKTGQAHAVLEAAKNWVKTTQEHLKASQEMYLQSSKHILDQQNRLAEIQGEVTRLTRTDFRLVEVKAILIDCISLMVQMKDEIMNMCRFLGALRESIDAVAKYMVAPFIQSINGSERVGIYTLADLTRTLIYQSVITIRSYFGVFADIAGMWLKLSSDSIMPGVQTLDDMMRGRGNLPAMREGAANLNRWADAAKITVKKIAEQTRTAMEKRIQQRVDEVRHVAEQLPPEHAAQKAIQEGTAKILDTAKEALQVNASVSPLNRFGIRI